MGALEILFFFFFIIIIIIIIISLTYVENKSSKRRNLTYSKWNSCRWLCLVQRGVSHFPGSADELFEHVDAPVARDSESR